MAKTFRNAPIYIDSRKIAEIESGTYEHASGDEAQIGVEGYMGHSDGADTVTIQFSTATPVTGHEKDLRDFIINKKYATVGIPIDGRTEMFEGRLVRRSYQFDSRTGAVKGQFNWEGGRPTIV